MQSNGSKAVSPKSTAVLSHVREARPVYLHGARSRDDPCADDHRRHRMALMTMMNHADREEVRR